MMTIHDKEELKALRDANQKLSKKLSEIRKKIVAFQNESSKDSK
jgi:cell fate (sporulation/competence/biofilm development) regulator YlbF (YheA/YmcA/DUF963 family)